MVWASVVAVAVSVFFFFEEEPGRMQGSFTGDDSGDYWQMFAGISTERKYIEEAEAYYRLPVFGQELLDQAGQEITLIGYYLPYSRLDSVIIISRYPNASCFFCGKAGVESVAMVEMRNVKSYRTDQLLSVKGTLELNATDLKKLAFIVADASVEEL